MAHLETPPLPPRRRTPLEHIHLINLPPYAPDHNPIEHVWNEAKHHISNLQHPTFTDTRHTFETYITENTFPYRNNKKYFV